LSEAPARWDGRALPGGALRLDSGRKQVGDFADFLRNPGQSSDQMPGFLVVEEAEGEFLQMVEGAASQFCFDGDAKDMPPIGDHDHKARR